ncbi:hypothetical protein CAAN1_03S03433 [[Candida] anglica]|uniref:Uncharacterized protein n=1 Tax=[Candida] anglica TaxID=148631 RepID=A0ABP0EGW0_9ASCO
MILSAPKVEPLFSSVGFPILQFYSGSMDPHCMVPTYALFIEISL